MTSLYWTDDRVDVLTRLWAEGLSASEVARRLGGVTRNAVIGKLHRLGRLGRRPATPRQAVRRPAPARPRAVRAGPPRPSRARPTTAPEVPPPETLTPLTRLRPRQCRWPYGDPLSGPFGFCGAAAPGGPYCPGHAAIAYAPAPASARRRARGQRTP